ncbi:MAG: right-handed parallel beta-helix repeat-containing protein [Opitutaceae bacterium]|nr:right-handed parallel beta-helix repeat-containing protein [Opitutaceae bacterium]
MKTKLHWAVGSLALVAAFSLRSEAARPGERVEHRSGDQYQYSIRQLSGRNDTMPGAVSTPYPTLLHLAVEWAIEGDDNLDGVVTVQFRSAGEPAWRDGPPLRRVPGQSWHFEQPGRTHPSWSWTNKHAGTLFDLTPGTAYEIKLHLRDPDGGEAERTVRATTRPETRPMPGAPVKTADPKTFREVLAGARPGDIVELRPGNYGFLAVPCDGAPGKPIVIRNAYGDAIHHAGNEPAAPGFNWASDTKRSREGEAIFEGISLQDRRHVQLTGLVSLGPVTLWNAADCAIQRCRVYGLWGITVSADTAFATWQPTAAARLSPYPSRSNAGTLPRPKCVNCVIADNIVVGITPWASPAMGVVGRNMGEGIEITGPGNVICHNRVAGFRDCISTMEDSFAIDQHCIDIYNNDIEAGLDDGIEFDYYGSNCRALRNRITNCFRGISAGPGFGGPLYVLRNVIYNTVDQNPLGSNRAASGAVMLHNTAVKSGAALRWSYASSHGDFRNNLLIGAAVGVGRREPVAGSFRVDRAGTVSDYNGIGWIGGPFACKVGEQLIEGFDAFRAATTEKHSLSVGLDVFAAAVKIPAPEFPAWPVPDLRLRAGAVAVDRGQRLPGLNDDFTGAAPDLGAYELGARVPMYGPRPLPRE